MNKKKPPHVETGAILDLALDETETELQLYQFQLQQFTYKVPYMTVYLKTLNKA